MKRTNAKHMRFKGYADGGKVLKSEYGEPSFLKSVAAKAGVGDGYSYFPKKAPAPPPPPKKEDRIDVSNATTKFAEVIRKRKRDID